MFRNIFDSYYYGKNNRDDYTPEDLPDNRFALFFTVLRIRFGNLIGLNLLAFIFWLPMVMWTVINLFNVEYLLQQAAESFGGELSTINFQTSSELISTLFMYFTGLVPCLIIAGLASGGLAYVARYWARDQHASTVSDFWLGLKQNWKQCLGVGAINSMVPIIALSGYYFYGTLAQNNIIFMLLQFLVLLVCGYWALMMIVIHPLMVSYDLKFKVLIKNAAILTLIRLPQSLLISLCALVPMVLMLINRYFALYYLIIGFSLTQFINCSYANAIFDKYINPRIKGARIASGMRGSKVVHNISQDEDQPELEDDFKPLE